MAIPLGQPTTAERTERLTTAEVLKRMDYDALVSRRLAGEPGAANARRKAAKDKPVSRTRNKAQDKPARHSREVALLRLAAAHQDEYLRLLTDERARRGLGPPDRRSTVLLRRNDRPGVPKQGPNRKQTRADRMAAEAAAAMAAGDIEPEACSHPPAENRWVGVQVWCNVCEAQLT